MFKTELKSINLITDTNKEVLFRYYLTEKVANDDDSKNIYGVLIEKFEKIKDDFIFIERSGENALTESIDSAKNIVSFLHENTASPIDFEAYIDYVIDKIAC